MNRRQALIVLGAAAFQIWEPMQAIAQQQRSMPIVGVLSLDIEDRITWFRDGLQKVGYVEGRNVRLETSKAGDRYSKLSDIATEFVRLNANVIVTMGSTATFTARKITETIPIVMVAGVDPVKEKLAASFSHPGGNVTGISTMLQDLSSKRLELTKEVVPGVRRIGVLWDPDSRTSTLSLADIVDAAKALNLQLEVVEARSSNDFDRAFERLAKTGTTVFVSVTSSMFEASRKELLESSAKHRLAGVFSSPEWVGTGVLLSYGASRSENYRHAAMFVGKILKGAKPGDLPIERPTKLELVLNMKTAKALGIKIPNSILVRADRVIE